MTTTNTRETDARLHELLFGVTCEMRYCAVNDRGEWVEQESIYERSGENHQLQRLVAAAGRQPCYWTVFGNWWVVPHYHDDPAAIRTAETALPVELREDYASELCLNSDTPLVPLSGSFVAIDRTALYALITASAALYALITATPAQRAAALVSVLERAKAQEVVG